MTVETRDSVGSDRNAVKGEASFVFFQAEDGIRDYKVTGVQTCALPILMRDQPAGFSGMGPSRMVDQSASSSSARIRASPVWEPWPISDRSIVSVTIPSAPMRNQALGANGAAGGDVARPRRAGR